MALRLTANDFSSIGGGYSRNAYLTEEREGKENTTIRNGGKYEREFEFLSLPNFYTRTNQPDRYILPKFVDVRIVATLSALPSRRVSETIGVV